MRAGFLESPEAHQVASDPNVAAILVTRFPTALHALRTAPNWREIQADLPPLDQLGQRASGTVVVDNRSSFVRRHPTPTGAVFVKVYEYMTWRDRLRSLGRRTAPWTQPRPVREFDALQWLRRQGFHAPSPLFAGASRQWGFLARAILITDAWPGKAADIVLPNLETAERNALADAIRTLLRALHARGFRDRNFDLRNVLVHRADDGWRVAKIDSPRHRLVRPGVRHDRLARADWQRLEAQLANWSKAPT
ncbi:MAG: lipopolysaccharide kinase InaA family protein [Planctomycetota bacterium]